MLTSQQARSLSAMLGGQRRAAYWRALGCANLVKAREVLLRKRAEKRKLLLVAEMSASQRRRYEHEWTPEQRAEVGSWRRPENTARRAPWFTGQIEVSSQLQVVKTCEPIGLRQARYREKLAACFAYSKRCSDLTLSGGNDMAAYSTHSARAVKGDAVRLFGA